MIYINKSIDGGVTYFPYAMDDDYFILQSLLDQFRRYRLSISNQSDLDWNDRDIARTIEQLSIYPDFNESDVYDYSTYQQ